MFQIKCQKKINKHYFELSGTAGEIVFLNINPL